jgi:hypothetical protein
MLPEPNPENLIVVIFLAFAWWLLLVRILLYNVAAVKTD